jgi:hypothetical protein
MPHFASTKVITGTTSGTIGTQTTHAHGGGFVPFTYSIRSKGNGVVYESAPADSTNIYVKGSAASLAFEAVIIF